MKLISWPREERRKRKKEQGCASPIQTCLAQSLRSQAFVVVLQIKEINQSHGTE